MDELNQEIKQEIKESQQESNLEKNHRLFKKYLLFFAVVFLIFGSFLVGLDRGKKTPDLQEKDVPINDAFVENKFPDEEKKIDFSLFWRVWDLVKEKHIDRDKIDAQKLIYGAIGGMLKATDDPYTDFYDPEESKAFAEDIEGSFEGIGAELGIKDEILTVIAPLDGSPAQKAGLRSGDKIFKVDDRIVADLAIDEAVRLIRGKKGTEVKLTILHEGQSETEEITITRDNINIESVKLEYKEGDIAHLRIIKFSENVDTAFNAAAKEIVAKGARGIILDVRDNPGGLLDKSVAIASKMIPEGRVVVSEENTEGKRESLYTSGKDILGHIPTVVLINEGSASASEIIAGALRDNQKITLIGKKSFGKGSVQQLVNLPGGSSVKITIAKWLTPNGDYIMEKGITPDVEVDLTLDDYKNQRDPQLEKAMEILKEKLQ